MERWITKKRQRIIFIDSPRPNAYALDEAYTGCLLKLIADNRSLFVDRGEGEKWKEEEGERERVARISFFFFFSSFFSFFLFYLFQGIRSITRVFYSHSSISRSFLEEMFGLDSIGTKGTKEMRRREKGKEEREKCRNEGTKERFRIVRG